MVRMLPNCIVDRWNLRLYRSRGGSAQHPALTRLVGVVGPATVFPFLCYDNSTAATATRFSCITRWMVIWKGLQKLPRVCWVLVVRFVCAPYRTSRPFVERTSCTGCGGPLATTSSARFTGHYVIEFKVLKSRTMVIRHGRDLCVFCQFLHFHSAELREIYARLITAKGTLIKCVR